MTAHNTQHYNFECKLSGRFSSRTVDSSERAQIQKNPFSY